MTDDELSRLLDEYRDAFLLCGHRRSFAHPEHVIAEQAARAAILSHVARRKEGEGGEDAARLLDQAVNRFLAYRMPADFAPDGGVSFKPIENPDYPQVREQCWPVGTNLLTDPQARAMFAHCLGTDDTSGDTVPVPRECPDYALQKVFPLHWQFMPGQLFKQQWREAVQAIARAGGREGLNKSADNAALIAAARSMLAALKSALETFCGFDDEDRMFEDDGDEPVVAPVLAAMKAAIAEAESFAWADAARTEGKGNG